jgi:hypothetical protein
MADADGMDLVQVQVQELNGQVTAFAGLGEAIKVADGAMGRAAVELARVTGSAPSRSMDRSEVRAVALA